MTISKKQKSLINDVNFEIELKGYSEKIVDSKQKNGLRENTINSLGKFGFRIERIPSSNFKVFKITK